MLAAQLNELGVSQGPEAPPRPNRQHKGPASSTSNSVQPASGNDQNNKQMPQSSSILDQVSDRSQARGHTFHTYFSSQNIFHLRLCILVPVVTFFISFTFSVRLFLIT